MSGNRLPDYLEHIRAAAEDALVFVAEIWTRRRLSQTGGRNAPSL